MRRIIKTTSPDYFDQWKENYRNKHGRDAIYEQFNCAERQELKEFMRNEQYGLCCYCMKRVKYREGHIEHIKPQSLFPNDTMDYMNMLVSCNGMGKNNDGQECCGHKREDWFDANYISPLEPDVQIHFAYSIDGHISPHNNDKRAQETINHLELDYYSLVQKRRCAIYLALDTDASFDDIIEDYNNPIDGELPEYCAAVIYCVKQQQKNQK